MLSGREISCRAPRYVLLLGVIIVIEHARACLSAELRRAKGDRVVFANRCLLSPMGDQSDVRDRVEEETRSRTPSAAPPAILQRPASRNSRLPASMHTRPGNCGRSRCLPLTANHHLLRIVRGPACLMSASTTRALL